MHYVRPADFVRYTMPEIWQMHFNASDTKACIAWLFGYAAHLVADYTIHPIVAALVGPYATKKNRPAHRLCEFSQDVYLFFKRNQREVSQIDFLKATGLAKCSRNGDLHKLHPAIAALWKSTLEQYPRPETKPYVRLPKLSLDPDCWFATYLNVMENFATKGSAFAKLFGCAYMKVSEVNSRYIQDLPIPDSSNTIQYDALFEKTRQNLIQAWRELAEALDKDDARRFTLANADLDTGKDETKKFIYWA
jgi:transcriptional regulator with XRE-family HTH domain